MASRTLKAIMQLAIRHAVHPIHKQFSTKHRLSVCAPTSSQLKKHTAKESQFTGHICMSHKPGTTYLRGPASQPIISLFWVNLLTEIAFNNT